MVDAHLISVVGLYALQLTILYKLGRVEGRLRALELTHIRRKVNV